MLISTFPMSVWPKHVQYKGTAVSDVVPLAPADRQPNAFLDVDVRGYRTQLPRITLSEIPTSLTPEQLRSGAQLHSVLYTSS